MGGLLYRREFEHPQPILHTVLQCFLGLVRFSHLIFKVCNVFGYLFIYLCFSRTGKAFPSAFALLVLTRETQTKTLLRFLCTAIFVCIGIMLLINIIKVPWGRARMRLIYSTGNDTYFTNWWQAGTALKKKLVADGVSSDDFRSFPSGHTA